MPFCLLKLNFPAEQSIWFQFWWRRGKHFKSKTVIFPYLSFNSAKQKATFGRDQYWILCHRPRTQRAMVTEWEIASQNRSKSTDPSFPVKAFLGKNSWLLHMMLYCTWHWHLCITYMHCMSDVFPTNSLMNLKYWNMHFIFATCVNCTV